MLIRLARTHLAPYRPWLALIVLLQFTGTVAALYLPSLNADIIDRGVARGDTGYIVRAGALMLGVSLLQICCSVVVRSERPRPRNEMNQCSTAVTRFLKPVM